MIDISPRLVPPGLPLILHGGGGGLALILGLVDRGLQLLSLAFQRRSVFLIRRRQNILSRFDAGREFAELLGQWFHYRSLPGCLLHLVHHSRPVADNGQEH